MSKEEALIHEQDTAPRAKGRSGWILQPNNRDTTYLLPVSGCLLFSLPIRFLPATTFPSNSEIKKKRNKKVDPLFNFS